MTNKAKPEVGAGGKDVMTTKGNKESPKGKSQIRGSHSLHTHISDP